MANIEQITLNPQAVRSGAKRQIKATGVGGGTDFGVMLDAVGAMGSAAATAGQMYGDTTSAAVLGAAFSGIGASSQQLASTGASYGGGLYGGTTASGAPYLAAGMDYKAGTIGIGGLSDPNSQAIPGAEGMSQMELVQTMNQNNLQLLELQAVMQNNMQAWNTKSNILSADHRSRMSMIEKFTGRG